MQRSIQEYMTLELPIRDMPRPRQRVVSGLLSLPNELLAAIWTYIPRLDIENMSLVNRRLYRMGEEVITRHKRLKNRYRRVETRRIPNFEADASYTPTIEHADRTLVKTIKEVFEDPVAASYVEEIVIHGCSPSWVQWGPYRVESKALKDEVENNIELIKLVIWNFPYLQNPNLRDSERSDNLRSILEKILQGDEDPLIAILITLPNIQTLHFKPYRNALPMILDTVYRITEDVSPIALTCLSRIVVDSEHGSGDLILLHTFLRVPSLRRLHTDKISDIEGLWHEGMDLFSERKSNLEELSFTRADLSCRFRERSINELLARIINLKIFTYEPCDMLKFDRQYYKFRPDSICSSLLLYAGHSLTHLKIHARCRVRKFMGSLRKFKVLADIETDWGLVRDPTVPSKDQLTNSMPSSMVRLSLTPNPGLLIDVSVRAISHLIATRVHAFPLLESIHLAHTRLPHSTETELLLKAKDHNMRITLDGSADPDIKRYRYFATRSCVVPIVDPEYAIASS